MSGKIISIGTALPKFSFTQSDILAFMGKAYDDETTFRRLKVLFHQSGIQNRYSVLPDFGMNAEIPFFKHQKPQPNVENRMEVYKNNAIDLAIESIHNTLNPTSIALKKITHLITVTCTGLHAPGLSIEIIKRLGLKEDISHTAVNFMGCNAALYALKIANLMAGENSNAKVLVVSVELCTIHFQPKSNPDNLLSNTLFGDGAASVLVTHSDSPHPGLTLSGFYSLVLHKGWDLMGWNINPLSFEMILDAKVPAFIGDEVNDILEKAALHYGITKHDITKWAIHPGGKKILDQISKQLNLQRDDLKYSYEVLSNYGNLSSPTILFVLKEIFDSPIKKGEKIFSIGFGPGLSIETMLLSYD